jgi:Rieske Fe-S protein
MNVPRAAVRAGILAGLVVAAALAFVTTAPPAYGQDTVVTAPDGSRLAAPAGPGVTYGRWQGQLVVVFVVPAVRLDAVDAARGRGEATPSSEVPGRTDLRMFALSASSTFLGCSVGFLPDLGASRDIADYDGDGVLDGRLMDSCHQGQWDPYHRGAPVPNTPAPVRLAVLDVHAKDGVLVASGFDGPTGSRR